MLCCAGMQARNVTLRIELPPMDGAGGPCSLVVLRLDTLSYAGSNHCRHIHRNLASLPPLPSLRCLASRMYCRCLLRWGPCACSLRQRARNDSVPC